MPITDNIGEEDGTGSPVDQKIGARQGNAATKAKRGHEARHRIYSWGRRRHRSAGAVHVEEMMDWR